MFWSIFTEYRTQKSSIGQKNKDIFIGSLIRQINNDLVTNFNINDRT